ncbi:VOC family protein [Paenibacillus antarcticus]|uniref:Fosmidomycin resistance protein n=1 Tax=Paenibacillus antarcticus TaxID=253703 RepID=A0A168N9Z5_9BACL|nr:VOC family protein [Paenibacillus antarcticus]OAB45563.1 fosmidomycin resistance protein [Paenibacillus antarcticus]
MIKNLYETHLQVKDLKTSISFFEKLGLERALVISERKMAFFYIGKGRQLLGIREVPTGVEVSKRHFAFGVDLSDLMKAMEWLTERGIQPLNSVGKEAVEPVVHTWMPAAAVYFNDPDGNELEFICLLEDEPQDIGYVPYLSEWNELNNSNK